MGRTFSDFLKCFVILVGLETALDIAKGGIESLDRGLDVYHKILDKVVPWSKFRKAIVELDKNPLDYSEEAAALIGDIHTKMQDGLDAYIQATRNMFQWCGLTMDLLGDYKSFFDEEIDQDIYNMQRDILLQVLDDGITRMNKGREELAISSSSFTDAAGKLTELNRRLAVDYDAKSEYFKNQLAHTRKVAYGAAAPFMIFGIAIAGGIVEGFLVPQLKARMESTRKFYHDFSVDVEHAVKSIDDIRAKLEEEVKHISDSRLQNQNTEIDVESNVTPASKEALLQSIEHLITKSNDYRVIHKDVN